MIKITRIEKPEVLISKEDEWKTNLLDALSEYQKNKTPSNKKKLDLAYNKYKHTQVRSALKSMFAGKCAYCESHILHIGFGHIEHFQPKTQYPMKCFDWDNLLLSCEICNSEFKGSKFPGNNEGGPFINPVTENPDDFFYFEYDPATGVSQVIPKNNRASTTEREIGLNRPELVKYRSKIVCHMVYAAMKANQGDKEGKKLILKCCDNENEYAAFARALVKRFNIK
jgi:uncharacterized protein (TIGR02646 family)